MDGAILHNNPIQLAIEEARRLSEETKLNLKPDIVLSIGTGKPKDRQPSYIPEYTDHMATRSKSLSRAQAMMKHHKNIPFLQMLFTMVSYQVKLNIDCDRRFDQVAREWQKDPDLADRLHRINPDLGEEPPLLDAVDKLDSIAQNTRGWLQDKDEKRRIHAIACRLVASSFYFERRGYAGKGEGSTIDVKGAIRCRISETAEVVALGEFLSSCESDPTLVIINYATHDKEIRIPIQEMVSHGRFDPVEVDIMVLGEDAFTSIELKLERQGLQDQRLYRLSGFPRKLIKEDFKQSRMS